MHIFSSPSTLQSCSVYNYINTGKPLLVNEIFVLCLLQTFEKCLNRLTTRLFAKLQLQCSSQFHLTQVPISADVLNETFYRYRYMDTSYKLESDPDLFICPACGSNPIAIHIDGNLKLFRYSHVG